MYRENKVSVNVIRQIWGCVIFQHKSLIAFKGSFLYCSFKWHSFFKNQIIYLMLLFHLSYRRASQTAFCLPQTEQGAGRTGSCADHPGSCRQLGDSGDPAMGSNIFRQSLPQASTLHGHSAPEHAPVTAVTLHSALWWHPKSQRRRGGPASISDYWNQDNKECINHINLIYLRFGFHILWHKSQRYKTQEGTGKEKFPFVHTSEVSTPQVTCT